MKMDVPTDIIHLVIIGHEVNECRMVHQTNGLNTIFVDGSIVYIFPV